MSAVEANFDGLVGPTHNYAGLSFGNVASAQNADQPSNPREAARQGLLKMRALAGLGLAQGVLPPHERPYLPALRRLGFRGDDAAILGRAAREAPGLLAACASASAMWTANAATVAPGPDSADGRVHFTPANLCTNLHRALEPEITGRILQAVFPPGDHFAHHAHLPMTPALGDEGAANHVRLCSEYGEAGLEIFVYGRGDDREPRPSRFPARQARAAGEAIARLHRLDPARTLHLQQDPATIDQGVFHNDVIAVGNREVLFHHERAFVDTAAVRTLVGARMPGPRRPVFVAIAEREVGVADAVSSYLFNSQLVCPPGGGMLLVVARECETHAHVWSAVQRLLADPANPIDAVQVFDLHQSMNNGGGPACLRLRVVLDPPQRAAVNPRCWIDAARWAELDAWVTRHYRDRLVFADLADPQLLVESRTALDALTRLLALGSIYDFQRA